MATMLKRNLLNNMAIQNHRKSPLYQAVITDLAIEGVIARDKAEAILGYEIPSSLRGPTGKTLEEKGAAPAEKPKKAASSAAAADEELD